MPERTAFFSLGGIAQTLNDFVCTTILHIARNEFHTDTAVLVLVSNEVLNDVQKVGRLKHTCHSDFLCGRLAVRIDIAQLIRVGVLPLHEVADTACDAGIATVMETGGHDDLIKIEQFRHAFRLFGTAAVLIAHQLVNALRHRLCDVRCFALDDHDRKTVHKQNDIGDDMLLFSGDANLVLADGKKIVVSRIGTVIGVYIRPVDKTNRTVDLAGLLIISGQAFRNAVVDFLVIFKYLLQRMGIILNLPAEVIDLHIVQPRIQALQCGFQARYDNDL